MTARIVGGLGIAHTPSMGAMYDRGMQAGFDPRWQAWYDGTRPVKAWLQALAPTQLLVVYNDHLNHFQFDAYPTFALGVGERFAQADEGWGLRDLPDLRGDLGFGLHMAEHLVRHGLIDLTVCQGLTIDHGIYSWFPYLFDAPWPVPVTPLCVNMIREPLPMPQRLVQLGQALGAAVRAFGADERVLVVATGGMSHQISGARFGVANEGFDHRFLDLLPEQPERLAALSPDDYMLWGGTEAIELTLWLAMRAALPRRVHTAHRFHTFPQITGCGVIAFETPSPGDLPI